MPYDLFHDTADLHDVRLAGWSVVVPFDGVAGGHLQTAYNKLIFLAHLASRFSAAQSFRTESISTLTSSGSISVRAAELKADLLTLNAMELTQVSARQSVREAETLWCFRGIGAGTGITFSPPIQQFPDWNSNIDNLYGWAGSLDSSDNVIAKLSYARAEWNKRKYFTAVDFAGPSGIDGAGSIFNTIKSYFLPTVLVNNEQTPRPGQIAGRLFLKDQRRSRPATEVFGTDALGQAQVLGAKGAIWIVHGSFANLSPREVTHLAVGAHGESFDFSRLLGDQSLRDTMSLGVTGPATRAATASDTIFEGLSLWDLKIRANPSNDGPALL